MWKPRTTIRWIQITQNSPSAWSHRSQMSPRLSWCRWIKWAFSHWKDVSITMWDITYITWQLHLIYCSYWFMNTYKTFLIFLLHTFIYVSESKEVWRYCSSQRPWRTIPIIPGCHYSQHYWHQQSCTDLQAEEGTTFFCYTLVTF